jgi:GNAT superfamily N-acetyltransferase
VKSLFNAESGCNFNLDVELPIDSLDWKIGVVVGPSGSGKSSIGRQLFGPDALYEPRWSNDGPIVEQIAPGASFDAVTGALAAVGLGNVPSWLRPYDALSNGERFRANLARLICEAPGKAVVDEFTSVVDRQIAKFGALAFAKAWRRTAGRVVLLSCHYDILDWLEPDWIFDTQRHEFARGSLRRPPFELEIWQTDQSYWPLFKPHYYLDLPKPPAASYFVGTVDGELVCHLAVATAVKGRTDFEARGTRLVVMPEWQGAGVGLRFLNEVCAMYRRGENRWSKPVTTVFHTSHPALCMALRRDPRWKQVSAVLYGDSKARSIKSLRKSGSKVQCGYGGHFRAVQGFRFHG